MRLLFAALCLIMVFAQGSDVTDEIARGMLSQERTVVRDKWGTSTHPAPAFKQYANLSDEEKVLVLNTALTALSTGKVGQTEIDKRKA